MPYPNPPVKLVSFDSANVPAYEVGRQFDENTKAVSNVIDFLREIVRDDGVVRNGTIGPEQLAPDLPERLAQQAVDAAGVLLEQARASAAQAQAAANEIKLLWDRIEAQHDTVMTAAQALARGGEEVRLQINQINQLRADLEARIAPRTASQNATVPVGILGPGLSNFYATDEQSAGPLSSDYAQVAISWAEYMPDTIPPNILAINAITGQHWSSRWWAMHAATLVGGLSLYYCGAGTSPPATTLSGATLPLGALWFDTTVPPGIMRAWNGTNWTAASVQPVPAATLSLAYLAYEGQTVFQLGNADVNGSSIVMQAGEGVATTVNGVRLVFNQDFTVNIGSSTVTLGAGVHANDVVGFDILQPSSTLAPSQVTLIKKIKPIVPDGTTTTFVLTPTDNATITILATTELIVSVDGVLQEPSVDYTTSGTSITFASPPASDSKVFMTWFGAQGAVG